VTDKTPALDLRELTVRYGGITAVDGVDLHVPDGAVVTVLGANGAGKSSMLSAISGSSVGSVGGRISAFGALVSTRSAHRVARRGLSLVPEGRKVFAPLSVQDNLLVGAYTLRSKRRVNELLDGVYDLFPILAERRTGPGGLLSGGEQQMLAFGRAMMSDPKIILMDEPSMGLAPVIVDRVMNAVKSINERGTAILLVEQNASAALTVASYAYVLERGRVVHSGPAEQLQSDPQVAAAFLGLRQDGDVGHGQES
jgi:branched-chain amino acid transport system ATP-binding protein